MKKYLQLKVLALLGAAFIVNGCNVFDGNNITNQSPAPLISPNVIPIETPINPSITPVSPTVSPDLTPNIPSTSPIISPVKPTISPVITPANSLATLEAETLRLINEERAKKGLPALISDERIVKQARIHSANMGNGSVAFGHDGFEARVRATGVTYYSAGENVAWNNYPDPVQTAVNDWMNSDGHRKNILGNYNLTGMGIAKSASGKYYFTQIFIQSR